MARRKSRHLSEVSPEIQNALTAAVDDRLVPRLEAMEEKEEIRWQDMAQQQDRLEALLLRLLEQQQQQGRGRDAP